MSLPPPIHPAGEPPRENEPQPRADVVRVPLRLPHAKPTVTTAILVITILVYAAQMITERLTGTDIPAVLGIKSNQAIMAGQYWRLLTPMLLHGSILHIGFNMYALYSLGRGLEGLWGHARFLLLYLAAALAGNTASYWFSPNPSLGASTAVFGLIAAQGVTLWMNRRLLGPQARNALMNIAFLIIANLALGMSMSGIDNFGHLGGLAGGAVFAALAGPKMVIEGVYPDLRIADRRPSGLAWIVGAVMGAGIFLLALLKGG